MRSPLIAAIAALVLAACGSVDDDVVSPEGEWIAVSGVSDGLAVELIDGFAVTIGLDGDQMVGTAACNRYTGIVAIGPGGSFEASELSWTEIGCEPAVMEVEGAYLTSLGNVTDYVAAVDVLTLSSDSDEWVFERSVSSG